MAISRLEIEVAANLANLVSDFGKAQSESAKAAKEFQKQWQESIDSVKESFTGLIELAGVGISMDWIKESIAKVVELDVKVAHLSDSFGLSLETLTDLNAAAAQADQGLDSATQALTRLGRASAEAQAGNAQFVEAFRALGISVTQLNSLSPSDLLDKVAKSLNEMEPSAQRTANSVQLFGRNISEILPMLKNMADGAHQSAVAFGAIFTEDTKSKAEVFSKSMADVHLAAQGLGQEFVSEVLPAMAQIAQQIAAMIANSQGLRDAIQGAGVGMQFLADHMDGVVESGKILIELALDAKIAGWSEAMYGAALGAEGLKLGMLSIGTASVGAVGIGVAAFEGWKLGEWARENFAWVAEIGQWIAAAAITIQKAIEVPFELGFEAVKTLAAAAVAYIEQLIADGFQHIADTMAQSWNPVMAQMAASFQGLANSIKPAQSATDVWNQGLQQLGNTLKSTTSFVSDIWSTIGDDSKAAGAGVDAINHFREAVKAVYAEMASGHLTAKQVEVDKETLAELADGAAAAGMKESEITKMLNQSYAALGIGLEHAADKHSTYNAKVGASVDTIQKFAAEETKMADMLDALSTDLEGPYAQAWEKYSSQFDSVDRFLTATEALYKSGRISLEEYNADIEIGTNLEWALAQQYNNKTQALRDQHNIMAQAELDLQQQNALLSVQPQQLAAVTAGYKEYDALMKSHFDFYGKYIADETQLKAALDTQLPSFIAIKQAVNDLTEQQKLNESVTKEWASIAQNSFDSAFQAIDKDIVEGGSIMSDLANVAKTTVEQILLYFEKLAIINPLLNAIFGGQGGFSLLPTLGNSALGSLFSSATGGNGGLLGSLFGNSGSSLFSNLLGSTAGAGSGLMGLLFGGAGTSAYGGLIGGMDLTAGLGLDTTYAGTAATNGLLSSGGDIWGGLGNLGGILGGAMAGYQLGGWGGAAALGALSYAIPVVGWIAGIASLVNTFTGGNVFGTSYKPTGTTFQNLSFGDSGVSVQDLVQEHKHGALFSGGSYRDVSVAPTQDQLDSAKAMFDSIKSTIDGAATALGADVGNLITGTFKQQFDSKGNITSSLSTVLGQTYKDTVQQFAERVTADNLLALLPAAQNAQAIAAQWQSSADTLLAGTEMLVQAQIDVNRGMSLLGSDSSLADITKVVEQLSQKGETLAQTYVRLQTEQEDLASTLSDLGLTTGKTGADFVTFADQLTQAAGGLQNLQSAWNTYYSEYYSATEQQANTLKHLQDTVTSTFAAIGEDPTESMAKFRADFTAIFSTLTPQEVPEWLAAADALAKLNAALGTTAQQAANAAAAQQAAMASYESFVTQFAPQTLAITSFESSLMKLHDTMTANIQQANDLAKAAGMAGASNSDLANIIMASAQQGVDALKQFEGQAAQLAQQLYGTNVQQLQTQLISLQAANKSKLSGMDAYQADALAPFFAKQEQALQAQIDAANAQAQQIQRLSQAATLMTDFSQIGAVNGMSLSDLATKDNVPLDQFAKDLGLTVDQLNAQYEQGVLQAQAALKANDYLADILAVLDGKPITAATATGGLIGSKSTPTTVSTPEANSLLLDIHGALLTIARAIDNGTQTSQIGSRSVVDAISTRAVRENAASYSGPRTAQPPRVSYPA